MKSRNTLAVLGLLGVVVLGFLFTFGFLMAPMFDCGDDLKWESRSPDGKFIAAFFERDCGATTDYSSIVSLRTSNARFDGDNNERVLVIEGRCDLGVAWEDATLELSHPGTCEVVQRAEYWQDIRIHLIPI
jgi:hypothetical protein